MNRQFLEEMQTFNQYTNNIISTKHIETIKSHYTHQVGQSSKVWCIKTLTSAVDALKGGGDSRDGHSHLESNSAFSLKFHMLHRMLVTILLVRAKHWKRPTCLST